VREFRTEGADADDVSPGDVGQAMSVPVTW
jgi:hypothetical protein